MTYNWITVSNLFVCAGESSPNRGASVRRDAEKPGCGAVLACQACPLGMTKHARPTEGEGRRPQTAFA